MANIIGTQNERVFAIKRWLGLNEGADGDTKLKMGEAAVMRNFCITRDGNLQKRPGTEAVFTPTWTGDCRGTVCTKMNNVQYVFAILGETLYNCWDDLNEEWSLTNIGSINGDDMACMFVFSDKLYIIADGKYFVCDGSTLSQVTPYIPIVAHTIDPSGAQTTLLEQVNKLTAKRRVWLSPDGNTYTFQLPEKDLLSIDSAKRTSNGNSVTISSSSTANGTVTLDSSDSVVTTAGVDTIEVQYTAKTDAKSDIVSQWHSEFFNGDQNNRIFLYGYGNKAYYTGLNYSGQPDPTYFPDMNEVVVGDDATFINAMIRYNSRLLCFKSDSTYTIQAGQQMLDDGSLIPAFYVTPVHKSIGCSTFGQVQLVENTPIAMYESDIYAWSGNKYGTMTADERQCKRISDRVCATLRGMNPMNCHCFDDNYHKEYYISDEINAVTLVWHYAVDAWSVYTGLKIRFPFVFRGKMYYADKVIEGVDVTGSLQVLDRDIWYDQIATNAKASIPCYWESGSMDFGVAYQRKYSSMLWIGLHPQRRSEVYVTVKTDKVSSLTEKLVGYGFINFNMADFNHWTFNTVHRPIIKRLKIKAKKFVYYKLIFKTDTDYSTVTMTNAEIRVRFTGYAK